jgi:hypothetical protein
LPDHQWRNVSSPSTELWSNQADEVIQDVLAFFEFEVVGQIKA